MIGSLSRLLATEWAKQYEKNAALTVLVSAIGVVVVAAIATIAQIAENKARDERELERRQNLTYTGQMDRLDETEENLRDLLAFVNTQRGKLKQSEDLIESLQSERKRLEPLVSADRRLVDAIFEAQEERTRNSASRERWIGFGLGVVASLLASLLWNISVFVHHARTLRRMKSEAVSRETDSVA